MKKTIQKEEIKFQIKGIELLDLNVVYPKSPLNGEVIFKFNINVELKIDNDNNLVMVIILVDILNNETIDKYGSIKVNCVYGIENITSFINKETNKVDLPNQLVTALNSISISTVRGVMYNQFRGTFLHGALLPIIDPTFLQKETN
jgi:hypothetical protein